MNCEQCGKSHDRQRFCCNRCKDRWHNKHNPRGMFARTDCGGVVQATQDREHEAGMDAVEDGWDGHKNAF